jgi:BASS family bile acid:Na+ symporter
MLDIDELKINFDESQLFLLNVCLAFIMFGISLDLTAEDFKRLLKNPKAAFVGLSSQLILLPILTFGITRLWPMPPSMAMGLIMVASCPGGNISNFAVYLSRGNTALSISLTSFVTMAAVLVTPISFGLWASLVPGAESLLTGIDLNPFSMFKTIAQLILIPLMAGMMLRHYFPRLAATLRKPINTLSLVIFTAIILIALYENGQQLKDYLHLVFWLVLMHNGLALILGYQWAKAWRLPVADRKAISMETGIQNSGLGLVLIFNFFEGLGGMMLVAAWWGVWDMISALLLAAYWRYKSARNA